MRSLTVFAVAAVLSSFVVIVFAGHGAMPYGLALIVFLTDTTRGNFWQNAPFCAGYPGIFLMLAGAVLFALSSRGSRAALFSRIVIAIGVAPLIVSVGWFISRGDGVGDGLIFGTPFFVMLFATVVCLFIPDKKPAAGFPVEPSEIPGK